ncbi:Substrate-specific component of queuosine-regulated ECF transporter [Salmonella enterica subsp. enterica]|uniref:Substrate-specific component of queuosine-regulated ECF transporter n=1 Tax=Salmonella enterica I TaxID=59201 RepID=A0A447TVT2_SALET|nr:Substrate-specific component of queuosine-regulated ECF transporter [Salmonella enterica subsp. enterica]
MARRPFSNQSLVLIVIAIAINMIGGQLISMLKLPIFLDSIGTLISAVLFRAVHRHVDWASDQLAVGAAYRPYRCRVCPGSDGYRSGRRVAGARRLVFVPCPK